MGNRLDGGWAYNEVDQLNAGSGYAYDMKGALEYDPGAAADPRLHFQYGSDDLLRRIDREGSSPQDQSSMVWDADEQRLQLTEEVGYDRWQFVYDTAAGIPAVLVQTKADMDNETLGVTFHVREPGGELLASFDAGGAARYHHFDALGSTVLLSDSSGNPAGAYAYGAWGDVLASPATWQPYQYVGQLGYYTHTTAQGSELSDWLQLGVRFYQPELGRFERRDPVGLLWNVYSYANNAPQTYIDPSGLVCYRCRRNIEGDLPDYLKDKDRNRHSFFYCNDEKAAPPSIGPSKGPSLGKPTLPPKNEFWWGFGPEGCGGFDEQYFRDIEKFIDYKVSCVQLPEKIEDCIKKRRQADMQDSAGCFCKYQWILNNCNRYADDVENTCRKGAGIPLVQPTPMPWVW